LIGSLDQSGSIDCSLPEKINQSIAKYSLSKLSLAERTLQKIFTWIRVDPPETGIAQYMPIRAWLNRQTILVIFAIAYLAGGFFIV
jgi:hypothetical protein